MSDNVAVLNGYTVEVHAYNERGDQLFLLVKPDADLDDIFHAWCMDNQDFIRVTGWLWNTEKK